MSSDGENVVVVAVRAEREISKAALLWALTHIVRPGDVVTLLAVIKDSPSATGWRRWLWGFPKLAADGRRRGEGCQISASCSQMALQIDGENQVKVRIKVEASSSSSSGRSGGVVAAESKRVGANWVVLDKELKQELKHCLEELQCNIVVMKGGSRATVLRLNLGGGPNKSCDEKRPDKKTENLRTSNIDTGGATTIFVREPNPVFQGFHNAKLSSQEDVDPEEVVDVSDSDSSRGRSPSTTTLGSGFRQLHKDHRDYSGFHQEHGCYPSPTSSAAPTHSNSFYWNSKQDHIPQENGSIQSYRRYGGSTRPHPPPTTIRRTLGDELHWEEDSCSYYTSEVREAVSLFRNSPSNPPPLCSLCRYRAPIFGKPLRRFKFEELEEATGGFSEGNFLGVGMCGCVHRGVLGDGQVVAVKQLKDDGRPADGEFLSEVESMSRAQHRNVVMLVGFCIEGNSRLLVYEYICNGSLDVHLHGRQEKPHLDWRVRVKIAVGVARGLRYLHEDCRVGFIVHGDMRPKNILLTHDFQPMVGDVSLKRWHTQGSICADIHVAGTFGYLAPEYMECGLLTEKADVYAFGVVLLELLTGRRSMDASQPKGQQLLIEWARPLLLSLASEEGRTGVAVDHFLDPRLDRDQARFLSAQLRAMSCAASMCLRRDPQTRPGMSKILRVLEGDVGFVGPAAGFDGVISSAGSRSSRMSHLMQKQEDEETASISLRFPHEAANNALYGCSAATERSRSQFY